MACEYILIGLLIILIILILVYKCKNESFVVPVNANGTGTKVLDDSYVYPDCKTNSTCITSDNKSKTYITYKASDNRCIKSDIQVPSSELDNWVSYSNINTNFKSCSTGTNTMMSYVSGKYIKILRDDSIPIKLKYLAAYDITGKLVTNSSNIVYIKPYVGQYLVPNQDNINFQTGSPNPYIIIDLKAVSNISYIVIKHNNDADASSLNGSYIAILDEVSGIEIINYISKITDTKIERIIYLHSYILQPNPANSNILYDSVTWPCTGCIDSNNLLYKNYKYNIGSYCVKVKNYDTNVSWLQSASSGVLSQTDLDKYFVTCTIGSNTFPQLIDLSSGLKIWLNASSLGLANGTQLDTWSSKSPATRTGTSYLSGNATIKPKYYNNEDYPFVRFSEGASGGQLTTNGSYINFGNNIPVNLNTVGSTFILIYRPRSLIEYDRFLGFSNGTNVGNGSPCVMTATNNGRLATVLTNNAPGNRYITSSYNLPSLNTWSYQIIRIKYNTVSITEPSGTTTSTNVDTTYCTNFNTTQALLGAYYWYNVLYCSVRIDVRDFLYYDVFLSDSATTQVINNLKAQYNM